MPMTIACGCGNALYVGDHLAGKRVGCPSCGAMLRVPDPDDAESQRQEAVTAAEPMPVRRDRAPRPAPALLPPRRQTVLRSFVLALGILGGLISAGVGTYLLSDLLRPSELQSVQETRAVLVRGSRGPWDMSPEAAQKVLAEHQHFLMLGYLLLAAGLLGPVGGVLGFCRWRWSAVAVLVVAALAPPVLSAQIMLVIVTFPLLLSAVLASGIRPKAATRRAP